MKSIERSRWLIRTVCAALVVALLVGGFGPPPLATAKSRKSPAPRLVQELSNASPVVIEDGKQALPSQIVVSGFNTELADVNVTLHNLNHGQANDLDVLLVGPGGQTALIVSDVGSSASNVTLTLDDQAARQIAGPGPLANGAFQPTNFQSGDPFSPPAPPSPASGSELGVFNSTDPNGIWTLFVRDDSFSVAGTLTGGWSLRITSENGVPNAASESFQAQAGKTLSVEGAGVLENDVDPDDDLLKAILAGQPKKGNVRLLDNGAFTYKPSKKAKGTDSFTYLAQDPSGLSDLETVTITITKARTKKKGKK